MISAKIKKLAKLTLLCSFIPFLFMMSSSSTGAKELATHRYDARFKAMKAASHSALPGSLNFETPKLFSERAGLFHHLHKGVNSQECSLPREEAKDSTYGELGPLYDETAITWARILLAAKGIPEKGHFLLRHNIACYLAQGGYEPYLRRLLEAEPWGEKLYLADLRLHPRFASKLSRELAKPYNDREVLEHIQLLESQVKEVFKSVAQVAPRDFELFVVGSYSKGRIGANSDLDVYYLTSSEDVERAI